MTFKVSLQSGNAEFENPQGQTIMEAGREQGIRFPVSCRNGVCHICRAELVSGKVVSSGSVIEGNTLTPPEIYVCLAKPCSDITLKTHRVWGPKELSMKEVICQIKSVELIKGAVHRVVLEQPAGKPVEHFAGQYLALVFPGREADMYFSIASAPGQREIELHVQADPHLTAAVELIEYLRGNPSILVKLPFGKACLDRAPKNPVLLLAAGTGYAQMQSIIRFLLDEGFESELKLYWAVRKRDDLYAIDALEGMAKAYENFDFQTFVSDSVDVMTTDHHSLLADAVLEGHDDLSSSIVFVSGSPKMVYSSLDALEAAGLREEAFFSDVLEYASRDA